MAIFRRTGSRSILKRLIIILVALAVTGGCAYLAFPYFADDLRTGLRAYPGAVSVSTTVDEVYPPVGSRTTTYETDDSPVKVYEFYERVFRLRWTWTRGDYEGGLLYRSRSCPAAQYRIVATRASEGMTLVEIRLMERACL